MTSRWQAESGADGFGTWFTRVDTAQVKAIVPPGCQLPQQRSAWQPDGHHPCGWRVAAWRRAPGMMPLIDFDEPDAIWHISTDEVVGMMDDEQHETVFGIMVEQLLAARQFGMSCCEPPREELARCGAMMAAWLEQEIFYAFPTRAVPSRDVGALFPIAPFDVVPFGIRPAAPTECGYPSR